MVMKIISGLNNDTLKISKYVLVEGVVLQSHPR